MESTKSVINSLHQGDFLTYVEIKNVYLYVHILLVHQHLLWVPCTFGL